MTGWTKDKPDKTGYYWFYGDAFTQGKPRSFFTELHLVRVRQASNALVYIASGNFMTNKHGWWRPVELPELPKED